MNQTTRNAKDFDFVRIMCVSPRVSVANPEANVDEICKHLTIAESQSADIVLFPELSITGYTCGDLFHQPALINAAKDELLRLIDWTRDHCESMVVVGVPINVQDQLYNCAAVIARGELLGLVPKSYLPNYKEFYERRWFHPANSLPRLVWQLDQTPSAFTRTSCLKVRLKRSRRNRRPAVVLDPGRFALELRSARISGPPRHPVLHFQSVALRSS